MNGRSQPNWTKSLSEHSPERIGPAEKVKDIPSWEILFALCRCKHYAAVDTRMLKRKWGAEAVLRGLEPKLKCNGCDRRGDAKFFAKKIPR